MAHLEQTIQEKFPGESRVFPVSAKKAWLARTTGTDKEGLFQQSCFGPLETYIDDIAIQSAPRTGSLRAACRGAQAILAELSNKTRNAHAVIKRDLEILAELAVEQEDRRSQAVRLAGGVQWAVADSHDPDA